MDFPGLEAYKAFKTDLKPIYKKWWYILDNVEAYYQNDYVMVFLTKRYNNQLLHYYIKDGHWESWHDDEPNYWSPRKAANLEKVKAELEEVFKKHLNV